MNIRNMEESSAQEIMESSKMKAMLKSAEEWMDKSRFTDIGLSLEKLKMSI